MLWYAPGVIMGSGWFDSSCRLPAAPENGTVSSPFVVGAWDIHWDDPELNCKNAGFEIVGVNVYRSVASDRGPYHRINRYPIGGNFYRDITTNVYVHREVIEWNRDWLSRGDDPNVVRWVLCTQFPMVKRDSQKEAADSPSDVVLEIDGQVVPVDSVNGRGREIRLITEAFQDEATEREIPPVLPTESSVVTVSYYRNTNFVKTDLDTRSFYRITTVAVDPTNGTGLVETPLDQSPALHSHEVESLDWVWKEAIRRNLWILQQGGERVKVFVQKTHGTPCVCRRDIETLEFSKQPNAHCPICFGTGFVGGYEGPYELIIAPDDQERNVEKTMWGKNLQHMYEVWTTPRPVLTQRDFIVKQTNERYSIGPVRRPSVRGMHLQQHFTINYLAEEDIRYEVPIFGTDTLPWPETRTTDQIITGDPCYMRHNFEGQPIPTGADYQATPMRTEKDNIPDGREGRGRTPVWENVQF